jgi:serine/threonine protein kinase
MRCPFCRGENHESAEVCFKCGRGLYALTQGHVVASRYEILATLGQGGMGTVYKAFDRALDEAVALKVLRGDLAKHQEMAKRFLSEIKLARRVRHKNVCGIHEYGEDSHLRYISMEFIDGVDLRGVLRKRGALPHSEAFDVTIQIAQGLQAIHDQGIVHRDLKTANLMLDARGDVRLMDFGIAKLWGANEDTPLTAVGHIVGTPEYMSPEQIRGDRIDSRSDIYALGIVAFELFTGQVPFRADTPTVTLFRHLQDAPPLEGPAAAKLPPALVPVLRKVLAKDAAERYGSAEELGAALRLAHKASLSPRHPAIHMSVSSPGRLESLPQPNEGPSQVVSSSLTQPSAPPPSLPPTVLATPPELASRKEALDHGEPCVPAMPAVVPPQVVDPRAIPVQAEIASAHGPEPGPGTRSKLPLSGSRLLRIAGVLAVAGLVIIAAAILLSRQRTTSEDLIPSTATKDSPIEELPGPKLVRSRSAPTEAAGASSPGARTIDSVVAPSHVASDLATKAVAGTPKPTASIGAPMTDHRADNPPRPLPAVSPATPTSLPSGPQIAGASVKPKPLFSASPAPPSENASTPSIAPPSLATDGPQRSEGSGSSETRDRMADDEGKSAAVPDVVTKNMVEALPVPHSRGAARPATGGFGTVYAYREGSALSPGSVVLTCDDADLAKVKKNVFFKIEMPTGSHWCGFGRSYMVGFVHDMRGSVPVVVKPGGQYFLKLNYGGLGGGALQLVDREQAERVIRKLKPIDFDDIKSPAVSSVKELVPR